jgi:methylenetetrahydrofolate dehydrogenase (NADP+) / methenyltetrahydrofolate cyclohydrolase
MELLLGKPVADAMLQSVAQRIRESGRIPGLAVVLIGVDPASEIYVSLKERAARSVGVHFERYTFPASASATEVKARIITLNARNDIHGIIVQLPLPPGFDADDIVAAIDPKKDADGFHPVTLRAFLTGNQSVPPVFPSAVLSLLAAAGNECRGKRAAILANSERFASVMEKALRDQGIEAQSYLPSMTIAKATLQAYDIIILARGVPRCFTPDMVRPGAIIIDGGITRVGDRVCGDAESGDFAALPGWITPVPGGVGPVTVASLISRVTDFAMVGEAEEYTGSMDGKRRKLRGSVLGFSVMMLSLLLFSSVTLLSVAVVERRSGFSTQRSILAFQAADSAAERVMKRIYKDNSPPLATVPLNGAMPGDATLNALAGNLSATTGASCTNGVIGAVNTNTPASASPGYAFQVEFYDASGSLIGCTDNQWRDRLIRIRAEGFFQRSSRVIEVGIRPRT